MGNINSCCVHDDSNALKVEPSVPSRVSIKSLHKDSHYQRDSFNGTPIQHANTFGDTKCMDNASRKGLSDEEFETPVWKHMNSTHAQPITHEAKNKGLMNVPEENFEESPKKQQIEHENLLDDKFKYSFVSSHSADDLETSENRSREITKDNIREPAADTQHEGIEKQAAMTNGENLTINVSESEPLIKAQHAKQNADQPAIIQELVSEETDVSENYGIKQELIEKSEEILKKMIEKNSEDYTGYDKLYEESKEPHKLKIYFSSYMTPEKNRANKIRCEWYVPVTPEQFIKFMSNSAEQWKIDDGSMERFMTAASSSEKDGQSFMLYYLSYKKRLMVSARDLVYIKQFKKIDQETWADASISVEDSQFPPMKGFIRCENLGGGHYVKLINATEGNQPTSLVKMYSETDFKANVPAFMAKSLTQESMKGFIERSLKRLKILYPA